MESNKSQTDSAVSPTIKSLEGVLNTPSAGEAPMSCDPNLFSVSGRRISTSNAEFERGALVCLTEELSSLNSSSSTTHILCEAVRLSREYSDAMQRDVSNDYISLKQELAQAKEEIVQMRDGVERFSEGNICLIIERNGLVNALEGERSLRRSSTEKLAQMTTAFLTTEDALHNSKKALAAIEGKLGEMREALEQALSDAVYDDPAGVGQGFLHCEEPPWVIQAKAALEPIKKEERDL